VSAGLPGAARPQRAKASQDLLFRTRGVDQRQTLKLKEYTTAGIGNSREIPKKDTFLGNLFLIRGIGKDRH
jgi:hypothetical protein